ncbi:MAG: hypothetical protein E6J72_02865 [Deltaproteobacteria bacterium]|nr:MAG: hypothetical protein E6J72_02865 [Deltaproteobacteria bacterium]
MRERLQASMIVHGAVVFVIGLLAGFPFAFVILGKIALWPLPGTADVHLPGDVRGWHMAHLEGILNGLTLFAVAAIMPQLRLGETGLKLVAWTLIITAWGNIVASVIGPLFGARGLEFGGSVANSLMYVLFVIAIVTVLIAFAVVIRGARRPTGAE